MRTAAAGVVLLVAALCAGPAAAQSSAQVSVSDFSWALVDLDPNDGIDPYLNFLAPQASQSSSGAIVIEAGGVPVTDVRQGGLAFAPVSLSAGTAFGSASSSLSGSPAGGLSLQSSASLTSNAGVSTLSNQLSSGYLGFVLSPMTAVTFSSRVALTLGLDLPAPLTGGFTSASATLSVNADLGGANDPWLQTSSLSTAGGPQSTDSMMLLTFANALGSETNNELQFSSAISAQVAAPVPEPETWAMMLGGLALLAARARARLRGRKGG
jgi:hypothetical protein